MFNKKSKLILILLFISCLLFISVNCVSAEHVTGNNFTALNDTISNYDIIELDHNIVVDDNEVESFKDGIIINKNLTIDGCGNVIDGKNSVRIFKIENNKPILTLINITLQNGYSENEGGAIYCANSVNLKCSKNVIFYNNTAKNGAVIYTANVNIVSTNGDLIFKNNTANNSAGAILVTNLVTIKTYGNIYFNNNKAKNYYGGAIYSMNTMVNITSTNGNITFKNNKAKQDGGAICSNNKVFIKAYGDIYFSDNIAEKNGGAIYSNNLTNITSTKNKITFENNNAIQSGGAISTNNDLIINAYNDIYFNTNIANTNGGSIYSNTFVNITNIKGNLIFNNNNATHSGGAIYATDYIIIKTCGDIYFYNNKVKIWQGGSIYSKNKVTITSTNGNVTFENNIANEYGGAICADDNVIIKAHTNIYFNKNTANKNQGGSINSDNVVNITSTNGNITFENNIANEYGGAISADNGIIIKTDANIYFNKNTAKYGGAIYSAYGMVNITTTNVKFEDNKANNGNGGAILGKGVVINATDKVKFIINTASSSGGAIYSYSSVNITHAIFYGNDARLGKAIAISDWANSNLTGNFWDSDYKNETEFKKAKLIYDDENKEFCYPDNWVLLNITTPKEIIVGSNNIFTLVFNSYTNGTWIKPYDNFTLSVIVKTSYDDGFATLNPIAPGNFIVIPNKTGNSTLSILNYYTGEEIIKTSFNIIPMNSTLKIFVRDIVYGEDANILIYLIGADGKVINGKVNVTIDKLYIIDVINGIGQKTISNLSAKTYNIITNFAGDTTYKNVTNSTTFKIAKKEIVLNANDLYIIFNESGNLTITTSEPINTNVTVKYTDKIKTVEIKNGQGILEIKDLAIGSYPVTISLNNHENYTAKNTSCKINIINPSSKEKTYLTIKATNIVYGKNSNIIINYTYTNGTGINSKILIKLYQNGIVKHSEVRNTINGIDNFNISGLNAGYYVIEVFSPENETIEYNYNYTYFEVAKANSYLETYIQDITYDEIAYLQIYFEGPQYANINIFINNKLITGTIQSGYQTLPLSLDAGNYSIITEFYGNQNYNGSCWINHVTVNKVKTKMNLTIDNITYGETGILNITMNQNINVPVSIYANGIKINTVNLINGKLSVNLTNFDANTYNIEVRFEGNTNYEKSTTTTKWTVNKINTTINITIKDIIYSETGKLIIDLNQKINVPVTITINENEKIINLINGHAIADLTGYNAGTYNIKVEFKGNSNYKTTNTTTNWIVKKANTTFKITTENITYGQDEIITINVGNNLNGITIITGLENEIIIEVINGVGSTKVSNLKAGIYNIKGIFTPENINYNNAKNTSSFTVTDKNIYLKIINLTKYYGNDEKVKAYLYDADGNPIANQIITFTLNGVSYDRKTNTEGIAELAINLNSGNYSIIATFNNTLKDTGSVHILTTVEGNDINLMYKDGTKYVATFKDSKGNILTNTQVTFNINGVFYTKTTDMDGKASLTINLNPGEYIITAYNPITRESHSNKITVLSEIIGYDLTKYYGETGFYRVSAHDKQGNPLVNVTITININGVFYYKNTDENGIALLAINLNPGEYIATAYYNGYATSNKITVLE